MQQTSRAAQVLVITILAWIAATVVMLAWIGALLAGVTSSQQVDDVMVLVLLIGPQVLIAAVGILALVAIRRNGSWALFLGGLWAALETIFAVLAASQILVLGLRVVTEGWTVSWNAAEASFAFAHPGGTVITHWPNLAAVPMLLVAIVGLAAAVRLIRGRDTTSQAADSTAGA
jgi:hypothetical protein